MFTSRLIISLAIISEPKTSKHIAREPKVYCLLSTYLLRYMAQSRFSCDKAHQTSSLFFPVFTFPVDHSVLLRGIKPHLALKGHSGD
jgi:hypothetical protein